MLKIESKLQHVSTLKSLLPDKKFLVVGKGPSVERWKNKYLDEYNVIGINHVAETLNTPISHFADYEMFTDQKLHSKYVIISGMMNYQNKTNLNIQQLIKNDPQMAILKKEKRLFTYDVVTCDGKKSNIFEQEPLLFKYASGVILIQIGIIWGLSEIYTLGIDGGETYHCSFENVKGNGLYLDNQIVLMNELAFNRLKIIKL